MRKYISVGTSTNNEGGVNIDIQVLDTPMSMVGMMGMMGSRAVGYIEASDMDDLYTPASLMVQAVTGDCDEELVENVAAAFRKILTPRATVSINGEHFA